MWALKMAQVLLGLDAAGFWSRTPIELASEFWARRRRNNHSLAVRAWELEWTLTPHVSRRDRSKVRAQRILWGAPGYDPDEDEILIESSRLAQQAIVIPKKVSRQEGLDELNAVFDKIEVRTREMERSSGTR